MYCDFSPDIYVRQKYFLIMCDGFETFINKYSFVKEDYIKKSIGSGWQNYEVITLTPEALKKICISTNYKIGWQV